MLGNDEAGGRPAVHAELGLLRDDAAAGVTGDGVVAVAGEVAGGQRRAVIERPDPDVTVSCHHHAILLEVSRQHCARHSLVLAHNSIAAAKPGGARVAVIRRNIVSGRDQDSALVDELGGIGGVV